eukprot:167831-Pyramimonas_sp.AAC.1
MGWRGMTWDDIGRRGMTTWSRGSPGTPAAHRGDTDHPPVATLTKQLEEERRRRAAEGEKAEERLSVMGRELADARQTSRKTG